MTKTKTHQVTAQELYELVSDTPALTEDMRAFWLERFQHIPPVAQNELALHVREAEAELEQEDENHIARTAEIHAKYESKLRRLAQDHKLHLVAGVAPVRKKYEDEVLNDTFLEELKRYDY